MTKVKSLLNIDSVIRIVTIPYLQYIHRLTSEGQYSYIPCSRFFSDSGNICPVCETGNRPTQRWFLGAINKTTGAYGVYQIGRSQFAQLQEFTRGAASIKDGVWDCDIRAASTLRAGRFPDTTFTLLKPEAINLDSVRPDGYKEELLNLCRPIAPEEAAKLLKDFDTFGCITCADCHDFCGQRCQIDSFKQ